ncbi:BsuBI/PstI family type II restriction endonuclease [Microbacterium sp. USTB-Y]|uniref:BsuBI/PstI family type II restriction endonuclease n=1 Tax=Microbacterium sp. USTB-Y TaxID=2823692 RepID=UPI00203D0920|nr:BsuBI/PstI family type II restriction endonuclease [Microbacterium sp. USTB-Y]
MIALLPADECVARLNVIFPRAVFDSVMSSPLAGQAVAALLYVDAVAIGTVDFWARPSMVMWFSGDTMARSEVDERREWRSAAVRGRRAVESVLESWHVPLTASYADNSRETLRDETFRLWREAGAIRERAGVPKNSSKGRWALEPHFAALFDPSLDESALEAAAANWQKEHLSPGAKVKLQFERSQSQADHGVAVELPGGAGTRRLEAGVASLILKTVIEKWAPLRLAHPFVVTISEPGDKIYMADEKLLGQLGLQINVSALLPDAIIADIRDDGAVQFWFVEAVNTDGEIHEARRADLIKWATSHGIQEGYCSFLTAFKSRNDAAARKRLKSLASDTYAFFADEPDHELAWYRV